MRIPDWIVLTAILGVVLWALFSGARKADAPEAPPPEITGVDTPLLQGPNPFDEEVLVQIGDVSDGVGTAFSLDRDNGVWVTAKHVVDGCARVGLLYGGGRVLMIDRQNVVTSPDSDVAILKTRRAPHSLNFMEEGELRLNQSGFHIGYPQGEPGEVTSRLLSRSRLITRGRYRADESVLAWAEMGRTRGINGSLAGISGAPVFDQNGNVLGVTVAESPRRGRIYTAAPESLSQILDDNAIKLNVGETFPIGISTYGQEGDRLRRELAVVKVICRAQNS